MTGRESFWSAVAAIAACVAIVVTSYYAYLEVATNIPFFEIKEINKVEYEDHQLRSIHIIFENTGEHPAGDLRLKTWIIDRDSGVGTFVTSSVAFDITTLHHREAPFDINFNGDTLISSVSQNKYIVFEMYFVDAITKFSRSQYIFVKSISGTLKLEVISIEERDQILALLRNLNSQYYVENGIY